MYSRIKQGKKIEARSYILLLILLLSFLFRFYNLKDWVFFGMDQEYQGLIVRNILNGKHIPLIGVNASDTGLYLGPAFTYFTVLPFAIFSGNPVGLAAVASLLGVFVTYLVYRVGKVIFSEKAGLFASLFYAASFLIAFYDRQFWNPMFIPLSSLVVGYLVFQLLKGSGKKLIVLTAVFGLAVQSHLSILIFAPLIVYAIWVKRKKLNRKIILASLIVLIVTQLPLIAFEVRHGFLNTRAAINLVSGKNQIANPSKLSERTTLLFSTLGRFFWMPAAPDLFLESGQCSDLTNYRKDASPEGILIVLGGLLAFVWYVRQKYKEGRLKTLHKASFKLASGIVVLTVLFVLFYKRSVFEYYFLYLLPWLAILIGAGGYFIWRKKEGKYFVLLFILLFVILNLITLFTASFSYSYTNKIKSINFAKKVIGNDTYSLEALGECQRFGGYRYLFEHVMKAPARSYMDSYFAWLYKDEIKSSPSAKIVLLSLIDPRNSDGVKNRWEKAKFEFLTNYNLVAKKRFEKIQLLILTPKEGKNRESP